MCWHDWKMLGLTSDLSTGVFVCLKCDSGMQQKDFSWWIMRRLSRRYKTPEEMKKYLSNHKEK